jgi:hypothetical protein
MKEEIKKFTIFALHCVLLFTINQQAEPFALIYQNNSYKPL